MPTKPKKQKDFEELILNYDVDHYPGKPYCTCLSPTIQLLPVEKCLGCGRKLKPKRTRKGKGRV